MSKDEESQGLDENHGGHTKGKRKQTTIGEETMNCKEIEIEIEISKKKKKKKKKCRNELELDPNGSNSSTTHQDPDLSFIPSLNDEIALLILSRVPRSQYKKLSSINRRYLSLIKSGELYSIRKSNGIKEPTVLMLASGELNWWSYDPLSKTRRNLPILPSDSCFSAFDKESICAGTHLLISGKEIEGSSIWRYELISDQWFKGPLFINPRCLFASANCGNVACVAGGVGSGSGSGLPRSEVLNSAEIYDSEEKTWSLLPRMKLRRKLCSGCFMDNKFYVIGGQNEKGENLTCGECYDLDTDSWELIPDMIKDSPSLSSRSPPLVAVANNELYSLEASTNQLRVYIKKSRTWKDLGKVPVRADHSRGWGVAFKSLGEELLIIGSTADTYTCRGMTICTCRPDPDSNSLDWKVLASDGEQWSSFIFNCSIMVV